MVNNWFPRSNLYPLSHYDLYLVLFLRFYKMKEHVKHIQNFKCLKMLKTNLKVVFGF